jgi:hypothetical protein
VTIHKTTGVVGEAQNPDTNQLLRLSRILWKVLELCGDILEQQVCPGWSKRLAKAGVRSPKTLGGKQGLRVSLRCCSLQSERDLLGGYLGPIFSWDPRERLVLTVLDKGGLQNHSPIPFLESQ